MAGSSVYDQPERQKPGPVRRHFQVNPIAVRASGLLLSNGIVTPAIRAAAYLRPRFLAPFFRDLSTSTARILGNRLPFSVAIFHIVRQDITCSCQKGIVTRFSASACPAPGALPREPNVSEGWKAVTVCKLLGHRTA